MTSEGFRDDSVTRLLHADPAMWIAGVRALYLQALHPRVVAGVLQRSSFRSDPVGRLMRTARFVAVLTYAPADVAERAAARVRRVHAALRATDAAGAGFRLDEPELLRWTHCAAIDSYAHVVRRSGLRLSPAQVDAYVAEQRVSAAAVGLDPDSVPGDAAALADYLESMRPVLSAGADAQDIHRFLTRPPAPAGFAGVAYDVASAQVWRRMSLVAYSALPGWAIRLYGHPAYPAAVTTAALRAMAGAGRLIPRSLRARLVLS